MTKKKTKKWLVTLPLTGIVHIEVEMPIDATEEDAIEEAMGMEADPADVQWETVRAVCEGNVFCGMQNEATAEESEDD